MDDVASRQYNMWQTSFTSDNVESSKVGEALLQLCELPNNPLMARSHFQDKTRESTHALKKPTTVASTNNFKWYAPCACAFHLKTVPVSSP